MGLFGLRQLDGQVSLMQLYKVVVRQLVVNHVEVEVIQ